MCIRDRVRCLEKFRIYVLGQPLTIITANKALIFMSKCHLNNSRITRWILSIQEYNFDIIHCKGKENIVADILSRYPEDMTKEDPVDDSYEYQMNHTIIKMSKEMNMMLKNFETYQLEDKKLQQIMKDLTTDDKNELCKFYKCSNDKLYRKSKGRWKLYVPESVTGRLIEEIHTMYGLSLIHI